MKFQSSGARLPMVLNNHASCLITKAFHHISLPPRQISCCHPAPMPCIMTVVKNSMQINLCRHMLFGACDDLTFFLLSFKKLYCGLLTDTSVASIMFIRIV